MPTILIADDDPALLAALRVRLEAWSYDVITSQDAYQALHIAKHEKPDLLVLDINMPAGSGFSVPQRLRLDDPDHTPPVIFVSGAHPETIKRFAIESGLAKCGQRYTYLQKPIDTDRLLEVIAIKLDAQAHPTAAA